MLRIANIVWARRIGCGAVLAVSLAILLALAWTGSVSAMPLVQETDKGCGCHTKETETWESSPHARLDTAGKPVAACETCHGQYVRGHPDEGMMPLDADAAMCTQCHKTTSSQYQNTIHAGAGIQCIGCHVAHSQNLRLSSQELCHSCHRDSLKDPLHTAHWLGDTSCTSCHMASNRDLPGGQMASAEVLTTLAATPRHDFISVSSGQCVDCHRAAVSDSAAGAKGEYAKRLAVIAAADQVPILRGELDRAEQTNRMLAIMSPLNMGFGISIGGLLGITLMLAVARFSRPRGK